MGKITKSYGEVCLRCGFLEKNDEGCLECFSQFIRPIEKDSCPACLDPRPIEKTKFPRCYGCKTKIDNSEYFLDGTISIGYDYNDQDFGFALHGYKNSGINAPWMVYPLRVLTNTFLFNHLSCIQERFGKINTIVPIPGHAEQLLINDNYNNIPVRNVLIDKRDPSKRQSSGAKHTFEKDRFEIKEKVYGNVLLFDDVLTRGSTSQSAAYTLKSMGGSSRVILFTTAKHLQNSAQYLKEEYFQYDNSCIICSK